MGSWSGTCAVTNLSIEVGDPVVIFLLANVDDREHNDNGFCYVDDIWCPIGLPIYGKYADYGEMEPDPDQPNLDHLIKLLREHALPMENSVRYGGPADPAGLDWDSIQDAIHESILKIRDRAGFELSNEVAKHADAPKEELQEIIERFKKLGRGTFRVGSMMVHREIYEGLGQSYLHWLTESPVSLESTIRDVDKDLEAIREKTKIYGKHLADSPGLIASLAFDYSRSMFGSFFAGYPIYCRQYIDAYMIAMMDLANGKSCEWTLEGLVREICVYQIFRSNLSGLRKAFGPQSGAGSQHQNLSDHRSYLGLKIQLMDRLAVDRYEDEEVDEEPIEIDEDVPEFPEEIPED
jgi:hypothetical protein